MPLMTKADIRKTFRELRNQISPEFRAVAAQSATQIFTQHSLFKQSQHIACYLAFNNEFDTTPFIQAIWQANKQCYLPVLTESRSLEFVKYNEGDALFPNQYAILEPENTARKIVAEHLDVVIVPLVAFDIQGARLGTGGGYYDRTFAFMHGPVEKKPILIGLGYQVQQTADLPSDPWDITLEAVLTEQQLLTCQNQAG